MIEIMKGVKGEELANGALEEEGSKIKVFTGLEGEDSYAESVSDEKTLHLNSEDRQKLAVRLS